MSFPFKVTEHVLTGQHLRHNFAATANEHQPLKLALNQYEPKDYIPKEGDVTIIATHGNGLAKELYEPLFEELLAHSSLGIRGIWIADITSQGASAVLNEDNLGNSPNYFDHSRDLLHMVNEFRSQMPQPIVGLGHSMGTVSITFLSFMHPSLFASLILIEPIASDQPLLGGKALRHWLADRSDTWPSLEAAQSEFRQTAVFQNFDQRVMDRILKQSFRKTPTLLYPADDGSVARRTPCDQELFIAFQSEDTRRPEAVVVAALHPMLQPPVLLVQASDSNITRKEDREMRLNLTGTGYEGSGGRDAGMVKEVEISGSHFIGLESVAETATEICHFMDEHVRSWQEHRSVWRSDWSTKSAKDKQSVDPEWLQKVLSEGGAHKTNL